MTIDVSNGRRFSDEPKLTKITEDDAIVLIRTSTGVKAVTMTALQDFFLQGKITDLATLDKESVVAAINELVAAKNEDETKISGMQEIIANYPGAGSHNSIYRGKNLGASVTSAQWAAISNGTFKDLYIGDYWVINDVTWRIAAFDYYLRSGDIECTKHHAVIIPDANLYNAQMNTTGTTNGAYVGSAMYTANLNQAKTSINAAFGSSHVLDHRNHLQNAQANGRPSGGTWYDSSVELMTEQNVYGGKSFSSVSDGSTVPNNYTVDKSQYPLFALRPDLIIEAKGSRYWLRDVVSTASFTRANGAGLTECGNASDSCGVRPAFSIS